MDAAVLYDPTVAWIPCSSCGTAGTYHSASFIVDQVTSGPDADDIGKKSRSVLGSPSRRKSKDGDADDNPQPPAEAPRIQFSFAGMFLFLRVLEEADGVIIQVQPSTFMDSITGRRCHLQSISRSH